MHLYHLEWQLKIKSEIPDWTELLHSKWWEHTPSWSQPPAARAWASSRSPPALGTWRGHEVRDGVEWTQSSSEGKCHSWAVKKHMYTLQTSGCFLTSMPLSGNTYFTSSRNLSSSRGETWEYLQDRRDTKYKWSNIHDCIILHIVSYHMSNHVTTCMPLIIKNTVNIKYYYNVK